MLGGDFAGWRIEIVLWLARATVLLLLATVAAELVRRWSAALAHRVWIAALGGVVLLPAFGGIVPAWEWRSAGNESAVAASGEFPHFPAPSPKMGEGEQEVIS